MGHMSELNNGSSWSREQMIPEKGKRERRLLPIALTGLALARCGSLTAPEPAPQIQAISVPSMPTAESRSPDFLRVDSHPGFELEAPYDYCPVLAALIPQPTDASAESPTAVAMTEPEASETQEFIGNSDGIAAWSREINLSRMVGYRPGLEELHVAIVPVGYSNPRAEMPKFLEYLNLFYGDYPINFYFTDKSVPIGITFGSDSSARYTDGEEHKRVENALNQYGKTDVVIYMTNSGENYGDYVYANPDQGISASAIVVSGEREDTHVVLPHELGHFALDDGYHSEVGAYWAARSTEIFTDVRRLPPNVATVYRRDPSKYPIYSTPATCGKDPIFRWRPDGQYDLMYYPYYKSNGEIIEAHSKGIPLLNPMQKSIFGSAVEAKIAENKRKTH